MVVAYVCSKEPVDTVHEIACKILVETMVLDCKISERGVEYAGVLSSTTSSRICLKWSDLSDYASRLKDAERFPDASLNDASNYCRNPDRKSGGPWCYWGDDESSWEYCDIPSCTGITISENTIVSPILS